ncbi:MAG: PAS domain S-box protein [Planctomycetes bacterium]|nr:PAS domain S-box protein [Planctomycetota bacterium]
MKSTNMTNTNKSIATKLLVIVFGIYLVISIGMMISNMMLEHRYQKENISRDLEGIQRTFEHVLAHNIWQMDQDGLRSTVEGILEMSVVVGVEIHNDKDLDIANAGIIEHDHGHHIVGKDGHIIEHDHTHTVFSEVGTEVDLFGLDISESTVNQEDAYQHGMFGYSFPIVHSHENGSPVLGRATVFSNESVIWERVKLSYLLIVLTKILETAILWFLFMWVFGFVLKKPLSLLASAAQKVDLDNLQTSKVDIKHTRHDELKRLETSFNEMISNLQMSLYERQQAEKEVIQAMEFVDNAVNAQADTFFVFNPKTGKSLKWNKKFSEISGYTNEEIMTMKAPDSYYDQKDIEKAMKSLKELAMTGSSTVKLFLKTKTGIKIPFEYNVSIIEMPDGENVTVSIGRDITERRQAEIERERLLKTLKSKNKELQSIVYVASHDLKSPLVNISGFGHLLKESCDAISTMVNGSESIHDEQNAKELERIAHEEIPEYLKYIQAGADKMKKLLDGLLQISRVGTKKIFIEAVNMDNVINNIKESMEFQLNKTGDQFGVDALPECMADEAMVNQIFSNLIDNAIKYLDPDRPGRIQVSGWTDDGMNTYCIEDNGIGVAENHIDKIFEIFHRLHPNDVIEGEGLGLNIVTRSLDRLNGTIRVESEEGTGSKFFVTLPGC